MAFRNSSPSALPPAFSVGQALLWTLLATLGLTMGFSLLAHFAPALVDNLSVAAAVETVVYALTALLVVWPMGGARVRARALGLTRSPLWLLPLGVVLGIAIHGPADLLEALMQWLSPLPHSIIEERARRLAPPGAFDRLLVAMMAAMVVPFVEELFFRGAVFSRLAASGSRVTALAASGFFFVVSHAEPRLWPALSVVAAALSMLRARSPGIGPCFLLHGSFNATTLLVVFTRAPEADPAVLPSIAFALSGSVVSVTLLALLVRRGESLTMETR